MRSLSCDGLLNLFTQLVGVASVKWSTYQSPAGNRLADLHTFSFSEVDALYDSRDPSKRDTYEARLQELRGMHSAEHRSKLVDALRPMMKVLGASQASMAQLERLRDERAVAVVTGQQSGLFGGPLYSIYKALTAVGLAERLERELGCPVVPVFWVASEDHDWDEVNHTYVIDRTDAVRRIVLGQTVLPHTMVYHQPLTDEAVLQALSALNQALPPGRESTALIAELQAAYRTGMSLSTWFIALMQAWLGNRGLVFYDPCLPQIRELAAPVFTAALESMDAVTESLGRVYEEVTSRGFSAEVIRDPLNTNVFAVRDGKRFVLERTDSAGELRARGTKESKPVREWIAEVKASPQSFSSNVLLRPVVQDFVLPTLCYVGGPSEIAYYPLSRGVFHALGRNLPPLVLRQRAVIYPTATIAQMTRHNVTKEELRTHVSLIDDYVANAGGELLDDAAGNMRRQVEQLWHAWKEQFADLGPQIGDIAELSLARVTRDVERMTHKGKRLVADKEAAVVRQLAEIEHWIWTDGHLQERRLSPVSLIARFGSAWLHELPAWGDYDEPGTVFEIEM